LVRQKRLAHRVRIQARVPAKARRLAHDRPERSRLPALGDERQGARGDCIPRPTIAAPIQMMDWSSGVRAIAASRIASGRDLSVGDA
jgi:hypothetical protein